MRFFRVIRVVYGIAIRSSCGKQHYEIYSVVLTTTYERFTYIYISHLHITFVVFDFQRESDRFLVHFHVQIVFVVNFPHQFGSGKTWNAVFKIFLLFLGSKSYGGGLRCFRSLGQPRVVRGRALIRSHSRPNDRTDSVGRYRSAFRRRCTAVRNVLQYFLGNVLPAQIVVYFFSGTEKRFEFTRQERI